MPVGKGSLQRAAGAGNAGAGKKTVRKPVTLDPGKIKDKDMEARKPVRKPSSVKAAKAPETPAPAPEKPAVETAAVRSAVITGAEMGEGTNPNVVSHLICELPVWLL